MTSAKPPAGLSDPAVLTGYLERPSFEPGARLALHLSCAAPVKACLVRLRHGDTNPAGPGLMTDTVGSAIEIPAPGLQSMSSGSYAVLGLPVDVERALPQFTVSLWVYPTRFDAAGSTIFQLRSADGETTLSLGLDDAGMLRVRSGGVEVSTPAQWLAPVVLRSWYVVALTVDTISGECVVQAARAPSVPGKVRSESGVVIIPPDLLPSSIDSITLAADACVEPASSFFDGKLEAPALYHGCLSTADIARLAADSPTLSLAQWDFSQHQDSATVHLFDGRPGGALVNTPARAVTGHNWNDQSHLWSQAPEFYAAVHFHSDDLDDAAWPSTAEFTLPQMLASGVYAVYLSTETHHDWLTFIVTEPRPRPGTVTVLMPTFTYLAYANEVPFAPHQPVHTDARDAYSTAQRLRSLYNYHSDGSGVMYASWRRPLLNMRPDYRYWLTGYPHGIGADLYILAWLEHEGIEHTIITDHDLHEHPELLNEGRRVLLTGSHPEYWSRPMMEALALWRSRGGRFVYFGGNGMDALVSPLPDRPHVLELRRRGSGTGLWEAPPGEVGLSATGERGGLWRFHAMSLATQAGLVYTSMGFGDAVGYRRLPDSYDRRAAFIFDGVGDEIIGGFGLWMGGAAGYETDRADDVHGTPQHALVLARSLPFSANYAPQDNSGENKGELVFFETDAGGATFSVGSITWAGSLSHNDYDNTIERISTNVLRRFLDPSPFEAPKARGTQ
jgi:N,N-dimethylformamidase